MLVSTLVDLNPPAGGLDNVTDSDPAPVTGLALISSALAVRGANRVKPLPDVPAIAEHPGMKEFVHVNWLGLFAPAGTPAPVIDKLSSSFIAITRMPDVVAHLEAQASTPVGNTPAEFRALVTDEVGRWKKMVSELGLGT